MKRNKKDKFTLIALTASILLLSSCGFNPPDGARKFIESGCKHWNKWKNGNNERELALKDFAVGARYDSGYIELAGALSWIINNPMDINYGNRYDIIIGTCA